MFNTDVYNRLAKKYIKECMENLKYHIGEPKEDSLNELREYLDKSNMRMQPYKFYYSYNDKTTWKYKDHNIRHLQVVEVTEIHNPDYKYNNPETRKYL